ncbi:MAG TPA: CRISPR-associated RAMP protein [Anaerolineae bacterium]|nr:CRISPR-associated RAMP protein [Anaerolineae bacterium]
MARWDTFKSRLEITAELVAKMGLRVGMGGEAAEPIASDLPIIKDAQGNPFIPGSSLRGVLRSHLERIVRTLEDSARNGRGACNPVVGKQWCITGEEMKELRDQARRKGDLWLAEQVWEKSCRVCRVFGSPWLASRVKVSDLRLIGETTVEVRDGVAIHREKETVANKYDFETVPSGARFQLHIIAENLEEDEAGLLWLGIRELERGHIYVGGFKGRGLGRVRLEKLGIKGITDASDPRALKDYLLKGEMKPISPEEADRWLEALLKEMEAGGE